MRAFVAVGLCCRALDVEGYVRYAVGVNPHDRGVVNELRESACKEVGALGGARVRVGVR